LRPATQKAAAIFGGGFFRRDIGKLDRISVNPHLPRPSLARMGRMESDRGRLKKSNETGIETKK
jgi:hypothetical protein